jgi:hypothetical protein
MKTEHEEIAAVLRELRDRMRRVETRMTAYLVQQGFDTQVHKPEWKAGVIELGSLFTPIKDIIAAIPENWEADVFIEHKGEELMCIEGKGKD